MWRGARVLLDMQQLEIQTMPGYEVLSSRVQRWINTFGIPERVAVVVSDTAVSYGIGRMLMGASGDLSERVDVFTTRDAALAWLTGHSTAESNQSGRR